MKPASMNHVFRLVWSHCHACWVAVAETARRSTRHGGRVRIAAISALLGSVAQAELPGGGNIVAGSGQISQSGNVMTVQQNSSKLAINWQSFSVGEGNTVNFVQPSAQAAALNRVLGSDVSVIQGAINANGQVFLINPNGVLFTPTAQVNVGGLVASTLNISNEDFLTGNYRFEGGSSNAIINQGNISAVGGSIALIATRVTNTGQLHAQGGDVLLAAGSRVVLDLGGPVKLEVEEAALNALIEQGGGIRVDDGLVYLHARAAGDLASTVINHSGISEARSLEVGANGGIVLHGEGGGIEVAGRLDTASETGQGGDIVVTADRVLLTGTAQLDSRGASGGGDIFVGGGWQGEDPAIANATDVQVDTGATIDASATVNGDAGTVVFWADDAMRFAGTITARGGVEAGDGGWVEVSGKQRLAYWGFAETRAFNGRDGLLFLDPQDINIVSGSGGTTGGPADWSNNNNSTTYTIAETVLEAMTGTVILSARNNINIADLADGVLDLQASSIYFYANDEPSLTSAGGIRMMNTNNTIRLNSADGVLHFQGGNHSSVGSSLYLGNLETLGADIELFTKRSSAATPIQVFGTINSNGGNVTIDRSLRGGVNSNVVNVVLHGLVDTGGGNFVSEMTGTVQVNGGMNLGAGTATFGGTGTQINSLITSTSNVNVASPLSFGAGSGITTIGTISFSNTASMLAGGDLILTANNFVFDQTFNGNNASITLNPYNPETNVDIGAAGSGDMLISSTALDRLSGFRDITIGRLDGTGVTTVVNNTTVNTSGNLELINATVNISTGSLSNTGGDITLTANLQQINNHITANGGHGKVTLQQLTAANDIVLGNSLNPELALIQADILVIGREDGGDISFDSDMATSAGTVHIRSGGTVTGINGGVAADSLAISAGGAVTLTSDTFSFSQLALSLGGDSHVRSTSVFNIADIDGVSGINASSHSLILETTGSGYLTATDSIVAGSLLLLGDQASVDFGAAVHQIGSLAADVGGDLILRNSGALNLGSVQGTAGVHAHGRIDISTQTGNLNLQQNVQAAASGSDALVLNAGRASNAGQAAGGNIVIDPGVQLLTGQGGRATLYTGSVSGSTGVATLLGAGSGRFRYNSDESVSNFTAALGEGLYAIYREQPLLGVTPDAVSISYGSSLPPGFDYGLSGYVNGDSAAGITGSGLFSVAAGSLSNAGHRVVGDYNVTYTGGLVSALGYGFQDVASSTNELSITPAEITVTGISAANRVYNGGTSATIYTAAASFQGMLGGDQLLVSDASGAFIDRHAGENRTVSITGISLGGADAGNYVLVDNTATTTATIHRAEISAVTGLQANDKIYDGSTSASVDTHAAGFIGLIGEDSLSVLSLQAAFADANAGHGQSVAISNIVLGGADAHNYVLIDTTASSSASILPRPVTVSANHQFKLLGQTDPALTWTLSSGSLVAGDPLQGALSRAPGELIGDYTIGMGSLGNANYAISFNSGVLTIGVPVPLQNAITRSQQPTPELTGQQAGGGIPSEWQSTLTSGNLITLQPSGSTQPVVSSGFGSSLVLVEVPAEEAGFEQVSDLARAAQSRGNQPGLDAAGFMNVLVIAGGLNLPFGSGGDAAAPGEVQ